MGVTESFENLLIDCPNEKKNLMKKSQVTVLFYELNQIER